MTSSIRLLAGLIVIMSAKAEGDLVTTLTHPNGLSLTLNRKLDVQQTSDGFRIRPLNFRELRSPFELTINSRATRPDGKWSDTRKVGSETVHFRTQSGPGGSGGPVEILSLWKCCAGHYVLIQQSEQAEDRTLLDFTLAWELISLVKCEPWP